MNGKYYPSFEEKAEPLLNEFGCLHFKFSILLGISEPAYSEEQLAEYKSNDNRKFEFEGKKYTRYEAGQLQKRIESEVRRQKDRAVIAKAEGDDVMRREAQYKINLLTDKYAKLSKASGLPTKMERMKSAVKPLTNSGGGGIMKKNNKWLNGRYHWTQESVEKVIKDDFSGIKFTMKPIVNNRLRCNGKTTIALNKQGEFLFIEKVEIGPQDKSTVEFLDDTILHEELEARIASKSIRSAKYAMLSDAIDEIRHDYINKVIKRFFKMKGWWYDDE